jgi:hypothetical protein
VRKECRAAGALGLRGAYDSHDGGDGMGRDVIRDGHFSD